jgi:hypothetical protein
MFVNDAIPPSRREYIAADANDPAAYDAVTGILKDGYRIRVPIEMMDSTLPLQRVGTTPMNIRTNLTGEHRLDRYFFPDGSAKPARKIRLRAFDEVAESEWVTHDAHAAHKPGYRGAVADAAAGQALKDAAYQEMVDDLSRQWMLDYQRAADAQRTTVDAARPQGISDGEWERERGIREMCDAWKGDSDGAETPIKTKEGAQAPQGIWPVGGTPVGLTAAKAGDVCGTDGARGRLAWISTAHN